MNILNSWSAFHSFLHKNTSTACTNTPQIQNKRIYRTMNTTDFTTIRCAVVGSIDKDPWIYMYVVQSPENHCQFWEKYLSQQEEHMQVLNWNGPGTQRSE